MHTKNLTSFHFLAAAALLLFEILPIVSEFNDYSSEPESSLTYNIGKYFGLTMRI